MPSGNDIWLLNGPKISSVGKRICRAREMFAEYMTEQAQEPFGHPLDAMPFHLRMMECILDETSNFFYQKAER